MIRGRWFSRHSLRARISLALVGLTLALGLVALVQATVDLTSILRERLQDRGIAIARDLSARSAAPSQTNDVFGLYQVVNDSLINNEDVRYVFLVAPTREVRVHTFVDGMPPALLDANPWRPGTRESVQRLRTNEGNIIDVAVPVLGGQGGVIRVGMSEAGLKSQVTNYIAKLAVLVGVAVLGAIGLAFVVSSVLTRPLRRVAEAARRVGSGDLNTRVPVDPGSELGDLARAFNGMTQDLLKSRESLMRRNTELEILNSMADTLSRQLSRQQVLRTALDRLLELMQLSAAWVCVKVSGGDPELAAFRGFPAPRFNQVGQHLAEACRCLDVFRGGRGYRPDSFPDCPLVAQAVPGVEALRSHAAVPLLSGDGVVGVLSVASTRADDFDEARMRVLAAIGHQIGIALENATLYEELERKERMRAELLEKIISAQEDERKRVAREIHDEPAQALSGVILQVDNVRRRLGDQAEGELVNGDIEEVRQGVRGAMESLHRIITELRPQALDDLGFVPAIRWYAQQRLGEQDVRVDLEIDGHPDRLPPAIEVAVFRITQEAINNVAKHAAAAHASIRLAFTDAVIRGEIKDDGKGFDPRAESDLPGHGGGLGLLGMRERAVLLGGKLSVASSSGKGTLVSFEIPLPERRPAHG
ncbi:MAG: GAF domain-containing protein [Chloroflexi bacterium]|nr:GAF domain-containing protein [Chloroflexota bacterium]